MPIFKYSKLVRDNIARWHVENGHTPKVLHLTGDKLVEALVSKLHEEADEVGAALSRDELTEEISDVQQVLNDLCAAAGISLTDVEAVRAKKTGRKGGFQQGVYIESILIPNESDEWAQYCRRSPEKYPELTETVDVAAVKADCGTN